MLFVLNHLAGLPAVAALPGFEEATPTPPRRCWRKPRTSPARCSPLNQPADREPGAWRDGAVTTAPGFSRPSACPAPPPIPASPPDSNDNHISRVPTPCRTKPPSKTCCSCSTTWRACRRGGLPGFEEATPDTAQAVLEEAAHFAGEVLAR